MTHEAEPAGELLHHPDDAAEEADEEADGNADGEEGEEEDDHRGSVVVFRHLSLYPEQGKREHQS